MNSSYLWLNMTETCKWIVGFNVVGKVAEMITHLNVIYKLPFNRNCLLHQTTFNQCMCRIYLRDKRDNQPK